MQASRNASVNQFLFPYYIRTSRRSRRSSLATERIAENVSLFLFFFFQSTMGSTTGRAPIIRSIISLSQGIGLARKTSLLERSLERERALSYARDKMSPWPMRCGRTSKYASANSRRTRQRRERERSMIRSKHMDETHGWDAEARCTLRSFEEELFLSRLYATEKD